MNWEEFPWDKCEMGPRVIEEHFDSGLEQRTRMMVLRNFGVHTLVKFTAQIAGRMIWCVSYPYA